MRTLPLHLPALFLLLSVTTGCVNAQQGAGHSDRDRVLEDHHRHGPLGLFSAEGPINTDPDGIALHGYDLVAYFTEERPMEGSAEFEVEYEGAVFRFANEEHRDRFRDDPEAYLPEYGGYCSLGVANGYKDGMHPEAFEIIDGRLFFNLTPDIHHYWQRNVQAFTQQADANWPRLKDSDRYGPGLRPRQGGKAPRPQAAGPA